MKEDAFIKEVIKNLEDYHNLLMNKSDTNVDLPKINLTELSKFAQLFY